MDDKKLELLKKIKALAEQGVGGEKESAQEFLERLMKKYNVTESDLSNEEIKEYDMYFKGHYERRILGQIVYKVTNSNENSSRLKWTASNRLIRNQLRVTCTQSQYLEIQYLFEFYKDLWYKELEDFLIAYVVKHELFGDPTEDTIKNNEDLDVFKISLMAEALRNDKPIKVIENKGDE